MTQESPTNALYTKLLSIIEDIKYKYSRANVTDPNEFSVMVANTLNDSRLYGDRALTLFEPLMKSEMPDSEKMNRFWSSVETDFNILQDQTDLMKAWIVFNHNMLKTELLKNKNANERLQGKLKTLQLYSSATDPSIIIFGDSFINDEFIDWVDVPNDTKAGVYPSMGIGLGILSDTDILQSDVKVRILRSSNGFLGNNQEINDPRIAKRNKHTNEKIFTFKGARDMKATLATVIDGEPNSWFEYEHYYVTKQDQKKAGNLDFTYYLRGRGEDGKRNKTLWSNGPTGNVLKLDLQLELRTAKRINSLTLVPHNLVDNSNNPIKISKVSISSNGTDWSNLSPTNLWVISSIDRKISHTGDEAVSVGSATWELENKLVKFVRVYIEQPNPIKANVGHIYYLRKNSNDPESRAVRVRGPIPELTTEEHYSEKLDVPENKVKKVEFFKGKRWVVGLRDINISSRTYNQSAVFVSKRFDIPGIVDRVALNADVSIPSAFGSGDDYVKFYISPNDGESWFQIGRIQDDNNDIPEIIAFNDPIPSELRESGVGYYDIEGDVTSIRFKVEFSRPESKVGLTPILKAYELKVKRR